MESSDLDFAVSRLGECRIPSTMSHVHFVDDEVCLLYHSNLREVKALLEAGRRPACFEMAGPRLERRRHAVVVVAEGAGQDLMEETYEQDASGNPHFRDIGLFLRDQIRAYFERMGIEATLKYIDPSYIIRSMPANPHDSVFCLLLGHHAVHAGMAGRTNMVVGYWNGEYTYVPIPLATSMRKQIDPDGRLWSSVLASTGQPREMR